MAGLFHRLYRVFALIFTVVRLCPPYTLYRSLKSALTGLPFPFLPVQGAFNIRQVGSLRTKNVTTTKTVLLYRSGDPSRITQQGKKTLVMLGVKKIFDMRAEFEGGVRSKNMTVGDTVEGWETVEVVKVPIADAAWGKEDTDKDETGLAKMIKSFEVSERKAFLKLYGDILEHGASAYRTVFLHMRDHPDQRCLVHCTAGKDRTGMFVVLLLMLLEVPDEDIANEYALTTQGLEPVFPLLIARFEGVQAYRDNWDGVQNMASARPENMLATMEMIRTKYGSARGYLTQRVGLTEDDLDRIAKGCFDSRVY